MFSKYIKYNLTEAGSFYPITLEITMRATPPFTVLELSYNFSRTCELTFLK